VSKYVFLYFLRLREETELRAFLSPLEAKNKKRWGSNGDQKNASCSVSSRQRSKKVNFISQLTYFSYNINICSLFTIKHILQLDFRFKILL
jgi:hypothetical protein